MGLGRGKGWKNIVSSDSYRHQLARKGIKTKQVSLSKTQRNSIKRKLLPLLANNTISGYNLVENPRIPKKDVYRMVYGHDVVRKHRDIIISELDRMKVDYYVVPREAKFLSEKTFIKTPNQVKSGDIISNDDEYQIVIDVNRKELEALERWFRNKTVDRNEFITIIDGLTNPTSALWELVPLPKSYTVPDTRIKGRTEYPRYKQADEIVKKLDKDTDLVILSVKKINTDKVEEALEGEQTKKVLVQDYNPPKHSLYKFIKDKGD